MATDLRTHTLIVTPDSQDPQERDFFEYAVECPGLTDQCRRYADCRASDAETKALTNAAVNGQPTIAHGKRHLLIHGMWMAETEDCYVATHDALPDTVAGYFAPGRHPVGWDVGDGTELEILAIEGDTDANH